MAYRVLQIVIVGFWAIMTGLLVRSVVSEAARYTEVPLVEFAGQILGKRVQSPTLLIFADGVEVGDAVVFTQPKTRDGNSGYLVRINGKLNTEHLAQDGNVSIATAATPTIRFTITANLDKNGAAEAVDLVLKPQSGALEIALGYKPGKGGLTYRVTDGKRTIYSNEGGGSPDILGGLGSLPLAALTAGGLPMAGFPTELGEMEIASKAGGASELFVAKKGKAKMGKHDFSAYVIEIATPLGGKPVRLVFSISGELMAVQNIPGHTIIAESFVAPAAPGEKHVLTDW